VKTAYAVNGHSCDEDADDDAPAPGANAPTAKHAAAVQGQKPATPPQ
jgi:hypothetical protein